ncbi:hypothetical protein AAFF_G00044510 [Aldrovandia affinis]|uniref:Uncharacterized protein n=1 Tax=Aldrovandia affinis TaxID=143900 RepID=A0AAD7WF94_9TELE|nr:hypothetical protein AAFF_G00044510 [Aldrovandia affinis]
MQRSLAFHNCNIWTSYSWISRGVPREQEPSAGTPRAATSSLRGQRYWGHNNERHTFGFSQKRARTRNEHRAVNSFVSSQPSEEHNSIEEKLTSKVSENLKPTSTAKQRGS